MGQMENPLQWASITPEQNSNRPVDALPVERVPASQLPYAAFLRRYVRANRPVLIEGAVTQWAALKTWTPEHFKTHYGDHEVAISYSKTMRMADFVDAVLASTPSNPGPYMYRLFLHEQLPELLPDLIPQNVYGYPRRHVSPLMPERWRRPDGFLKLLMGGPGSKFPIMHFDAENAHAQITEIYGDKEFVLFSPEDTPYMYPSPVRPNLSLVDQPYPPNLEKFPLLSEARPWRTVLHPGDMIFVPSGWWHTARPLTPSISVCTAILDESNWNGFCREITASAAQTPARRALKLGYLSLLGNTLKAMESLQEQAPALAKALAFPQKLAPATAQNTPEPSANRLKIRIPTD